MKCKRAYRSCPGPHETTASCYIRYCVRLSPIFCEQALPAWTCYRIPLPCEGQSARHVVRPETRPELIQSLIDHQWNSQNYRNDDSQMAEKTVSGSSILAIHDRRSIALFSALVHTSDHLLRYYAIPTGTTASAFRALPLTDFTGLRVQVSSASSLPVCLSVDHAQDSERIRILQLCRQGFVRKALIADGSSKPENCPSSHRC